MVVCAGPPAIIANMITSLAIFNYENYEPKDWYGTLLMWVLIIVPFVFNLRFRKLLNVFEAVGGVLHFVFFTSIITLAALAEHSTTDLVFKTLTTSLGGWENGLSTVTFSVSGFDGVLRMSETLNYLGTFEMEF